MHIYIIPGCWPRRVRLFWEIMRHVLCEMTDGFEKELASTVKVLCVVADDCCVWLQMIDSFEKELASTVEELKREKENSAELVEKMKAEVGAR